MQTEKLTNELAEVREKQRDLEIRKRKPLDRSLEDPLRTQPETIPCPRIQWHFQISKEEEEEAEKWQELTDKLEYRICRSDEWQCPAKVFYFNSAKKLKQKTKKFIKFISTFLHPLHFSCSDCIASILQICSSIADMVLVDKVKVNVFVTSKSGLRLRFGLRFQLFPFFHAAYTES